MKKIIISKNVHIFVPTPKSKVITVKTRKEFVKLLREMFIPSCVKTGVIQGFDIGYAVNHWDSFWIWDQDEKGNTIYTTVNLEVSSFIEMMDAR